MTETGPGPRSLLFDAGVALLATAVALSVFFTLPGIEGPAGGLVLALVVVHNGVLALRRLYPGLVLAVVVGSALVVLALGWPSVVLGLAVVVVAYSAGAELDALSSRLALGALLVSVAIGAAIAEDAGDLSTNVGNAGVLAVAWFVGSTMRSRRAYAAQLERRNAELEAARDELAERAVARERVRIARELHDVIAHSMSVITIQAGAGRSVIDADPAEAKRSLAVIEDASRAALAETRRVLGLLRDPEQAAPVEPAPSLDGLEELLAGVRSAGVDVQLRRSGDFADVTPGQQLALYRIVQEALTNVIKHSGARKARVVLTRSGRDVRLEVVDDGRGSRGNLGQGAGLRGMKERVDAYGGRFDAGDLAEDGFKVTATIPVGAAS